MGLSRLLSRSSGFTLVELLGVLVIFAVVMAGTYSLLISQQRAYGIQEQINEMNQNARAAMDLMTREIRLAGYKKSTATFNGIAIAQSTTIRILADLDQNGDTLGNNEDVTYSYDAGTMQVWRNSINFPLAENITNLTFVYTMADGTTTSNPGNLADIRKVTISITARTTYPDPGTSQYRTVTLTSDVTPRNMAF